MSIPAIKTGTVSEFDEHVGLGTIIDDGGDEFLFHCTQIAGGERTIPVGVKVHFTIVARHKGQYEASAVTQSDLL